jgi:O-antigen/teichoic acid export membrane protein
LNFSYNNLKKFLPFGLNFQANNVINTINASVIPGFVGAVSGTQAVGLVNWAGGVRQAGLAPSEIVGRLVFPACAQAQKKKEFLKTLIERMVQISAMFSLPLLAAIFALAPGIINIIYTSKWLPGLTALYLSIIQGAFLLIGGILIQVLFALGEAKTVRNISLFWTGLQWLLTVPLVLMWNFNGVVLAGVLVSATFFIPLREVRKKVKVNLWSHFLPYLGYSILTGLAMFWLSKIVVIESLLELLMIGIFGAVIYWGMVFVLRGKALIRDFLRFKKIVMTAS